VNEGLKLFDDFANGAWVPEFDASVKLRGRNMGSRGRVLVVAGDSRPMRVPGFGCRGLRVEPEED